MGYFENATEEELRDIIIKTDMMISALSNLKDIAVAQLSDTINEESLEAIGDALNQYYDGLIEF